MQGAGNAMMRGGWERDARSRESDDGARIGSEGVGSVNLPAVGRHDDHGTRRIDRLAAAVGQLPLRTRIAHVMDVLVQVPHLADASSCPIRSLAKLSSHALT